MMTHLFVRKAAAVSAAALKGMQTTRRLKAYTTTCQQAFIAQAFLATSYVTAAGSDKSILVPPPLWCLSPTPRQRQTSGPTAWAPLSIKQHSLVLEFIPKQTCYHVSWQRQNCRDTMTHCHSHQGMLCCLLLRDTYGGRGLMCERVRKAVPPTGNEHAEETRTHCDTGFDFKPL